MKEIINIHVPKTAGLSLYNIFLEYLHNKDLELYKLGVYGKDEEGKVLSRTINDFNNLNDNELKKYSIYTGHFPFGIQTKFTTTPYLITCLRNPIERVISHYEYSVRTKRTTKSIIEYLQSDFDVSNGMVKRFCGYYHDEETNTTYNYLDNCSIDECAISSEHLYEAIDNLDTFDCIMIQENFVESLVLLEKKLNIKPLVSFENQFVNVLKIGETWREIYIKKHGQEIIDKIEECNRLDMMLYNYFKNKFIDEVKKVAQDKNFVGRAIAFNIVSEVQKKLLTEKGIFKDIMNPYLENLEKNGQWHAIKEVYDILSDKMPEEDEYSRKRDVLIEQLNKS